MKLANRSLTFTFTLTFWLVSAVSCLAAGVISTLILVRNIEEETKSELRESTTELVRLGLVHLTSVDEISLLPDMIKGILSISRVNRIIRIFDDQGTLIYSSFPHDEALILFEGMRLTDETDKNLISEASRGFITFKLRYRLASGEPRIIQMGQPMPRTWDVINQSVGPFGFVFVILLTLSLIASMIIVSFLTRPIRNVAHHFSSLEKTDVKQWRLIPRIPGSGFLVDIVNAGNSLISSLQQSFLANQNLARFIAHEVRTPLTVMLGEIQTTKGHELSEGEYKKMFEMFEQDIGRIDKIVNTILELAQRDRGKIPYNPKPVEVEDLLGFLKQEFEKAYGKSLSLQLDPDISEILVDPELMTLLLDNLLRNAIKHSKSNDAVELGVTPIDRRSVRIWVRDRGAGLQTDVLEALNRGELPPGRIGIGLSLCREISSLAGIPLNFENVNPGLRASVVVPLSKSFGVAA